MLSFVTSRTVRTLRLMQDFLRKARTQPELTGLATTYSASTQQLRANVDRDKTQLLGIPIQDVYSAIQAQFGSLTVSQYNLFSNVWWVVMAIRKRRAPPRGGRTRALADRSSRRAGGADRLRR